MAEESEKTMLTLDSAARYLIRVQGCLEKSWSDRLAGMDINMNIQVYGDRVTTLTGQLRDQAELIGVLNGLYELRMPLLSLECISKDRE